MSIKDGGSFHPCQPLNGQGMPCGAMEYGLSIRDHFAGLAMQAFASNPNGTMEDDVRAAWRYADAMIAAREQRT